ncbi:hypothetical protein GCM10011412_30500 [Maribacter cobaltidurans]|nr:hypothetical protein GCM10011412_30500 [Maribacter cobaltidurans]
MLKEVREFHDLIHGQGLKWGEEKQQIQVEKKDKYKTFVFGFTLSGSVPKTKKTYCSHQNFDNHISDIISNASMRRFTI